MHLILIVIVLVIIWLWRTFVTRQLPGIPTPKAVPIIGHMLQLGKDPERPFLQMFNWAQECGGVYSVRILSKEILFINDYEALYEVLMEKGKDFSGKKKSKILFSFEHKVVKHCIYSLNN